MMRAYTLGPFGTSPTPSMTAIGNAQAKDGVFTRFLHFLLNFENKVQGNHVVCARF